MPRTILHLNNNWRYNERFSDEHIYPDFDDSSFSRVTLPHANKVIPYNYFDETIYQFVSCYRNSFKLSGQYKNKLIFVDFEGVMTHARVYLNGKFAGEHKGGYTPFSVNITEFVKLDRENVLTVMVDSTERSDIPPFGGVIDYLTYGGIYREVSIRIVDRVFIENVFAKPGNILEDGKSLTTLIYVENHTGKSHKARLDISLKSKENTILARSSTLVDVNENRSNILEIKLNDIKGIQLWDVENPCLYKVEVAIHTDEDINDTYEVRMGFREARLEKDGFYLNGRKLKIRGLNRHQAFPYIGYAMPARVQRKDADILKYELHLNAVRTSHYPQSRHFLDRCDEIGLLVLEEIPGWQHIGGEQWKKVAVENVKEMIKRDWNHPSIFLWGVRINESPDDHDFYIETNRTARELDDTRQTGGIRNFEKSELLEDVYTMNDFIHDGGDVVLRDQRSVTGLEDYVPYLVTEFNGHMYPTKRFDQEERLVEHALRHARVQNAAALNENISGAIGWCAFDYNTHYNFGSGDRICYHGVMDMFRIPKMAAGFYRSQVDTKKEIVLEPATIWSYGERSVGGIVPFVVFTNCDFIEFHLGERFIGRFYPDNDKFKGLEHPPVVIREMPAIRARDWERGKITGYVGGEKVIDRIFCKNPVAKELKGSADDTVLSADGMDATRVVYKVVDQAGNITPFINEYIKFTLTGPGEIIGPDGTALIGGCIAVWVKSKNEKGIIRLSAACSRFSADDILISVV